MQHCVTQSIGQNFLDSRERTLLLLGTLLLSHVVMSQGRGNSGRGRVMVGDPTRTVPLLLFRHVTF